MTTTIGFIGLGAMGSGMAANLLKAGFDVVAHDIDRAKVARLVDLGARQAASARAVAEAAPRIITIVETTAQTEDVLLGPEGIAAGARTGHLIAMMSTIDPIAAKRMHDALAAKGIGMLDAPVSGGSARAASGELAVMAGGTKEAFEAFRPAFAAMARNLFHVGSIGQGLAMKLVNNLLIQANTVVLAEAFAMGAKAGLDTQTMYDVVRVSTGASFAVDFRVPRWLTGDFSPGGTVDISFKDQELETAFAKALGVPMFMGAVSQQVYQMARAEGLSKQDGASIIKIYERLAGVRLGPRKD